MESSIDQYAAEQLTATRRTVSSLIALIPIIAAILLAISVSLLAGRYPAFFARLQNDSAGNHAIPQIGAVPPTFALQSTTQRWTALSDIPRPTLLVFYLGSTCPHCVHEFQILTDHAADLAAHHITVVGISADPPMESLFFAVRSKLNTMVLLTDPEHAVATRYGLFRPSDTIPLHATMLIDAHNRIVWSDVGQMPLMSYSPLQAAIVKLN
jgi:peroxiredoxin